MNLPIAFEKRMQILLGDGYAAFLSALDQPPVRGLRINPLKGDRRAICAELERTVEALTPISFVRDGYTFAAEHIGASPLHHAGAIYVQEPAAMAPVAAVEIAPHWWVADLCASPGGKSTQIAASLGEEGFLLSNEYTRSRVSTLCGNLERMGVRNLAVTSMEVPALADLYEDLFDLAVVDAPCSGEGMFRKTPSAVEEWSEGAPAFCAARQEGILDGAARMVRPDGRLVYSTCTFAPEENEWQVARFLAEHPDFALIAPTPAVRAASAPGIAGDAGLPAAGLCDVPAHTLTADEAALCCRFYPHIFGGEGQFLAVFARREGEFTRHTGERRRPLTKEEAKSAQAFLQEVLLPDMAEALFPHLCSRSGLLSIAPPLTLPERGVYAYGVNVGTLQKGRLLPHHQFFSAYGRYFVHRLELAPDDPALAAYLHGDVIPAPFNGWGVVTCLSAPIGGIKASGGMGKNHYPKGLRRS